MIEHKDEVEKILHNCLWIDKCNECNCEGCGDYYCTDKDIFDNVAIKEYSDNLYYRYWVYKRIIDDFED